MTWRWPAARWVRDVARQRAGHTSIRRRRHAPLQQLPARALTRRMRPSLRPAAHRHAAQPDVRALRARAPPCARQAACKRDYLGGANRTGTCSRVSVSCRPRSPRGACIPYLSVAEARSAFRRSVAGATAAVPLYDKSLRGGRGDRAPESAWPVVSGPLQVVCLEGWCLGFRPLASDAAAAAVHPGLGAVNAALRTYEAAMESRVDAWVVVRVAEPNWVFDWRLQAEVEMRKSGKPGLSDAQVADFVSRFMPAYKAYLPVRAAASRARACVFHAHAVLRLCLVPRCSRSTRRGPPGARMRRGWRWTSTPRACSSARSEAANGLGIVNKGWVVSRLVRDMTPTARRACRVIATRARGPQ